MTGASAMLPMNIDFMAEVGRTQVVIIAGGRAKRMGIDIPKCLLDISGKALIDVCIESLASQGFLRFTLLLGHGHEMVIQHLNGKWERLQMTYSIDPDTPRGWGKGKAFKLALDTNKIDKGARSLVVFPDDIIAEKGIHTKLLQHHLDSLRARNTDASILLVPGAELPYGVAKIDDNGVLTGFEEKPTVPYPVSVGVYIFEPGVYQIFSESISLADTDPIDMESTIIPALVSKRRVNGMFIPSERWFPINTMKDYERAKSLLNSSFG